MYRLLMMLAFFMSSIYGIEDEVESLFEGSEAKTIHEYQRNACAAILKVHPEHKNLRCKMGYIGWGPVVYVDLYMKSDGEIIESFCYNPHDKKIEKNIIKGKTCTAYPHL